MKLSCFITGTDTEIGKTRLTQTLMVALSARGFSVAGMKPIASGCIQTAAGLRNDDALKIQSLCSKQQPYEDINPVAFTETSAPHIAAMKTGTAIKLDPIKAAFDRLSLATDAIVVEGIGGWQVPLTKAMYISDLVRLLQLPVLLVVGLRLGCINHALLSAASIRIDGLSLLGWVANQVQPEYDAEPTINAIKERINAPCFGFVPYMKKFDPVIAAKGINISGLLDAARSGRPITC